MTREELKALREEWGMTQTELAKALGYSMRSISEIEQGRKRVTNMLENHLLAVKVLREIKKLLNTLDYARDVAYTPGQIQRVTPAEEVDEATSIRASHRDKIRLGGYPDTYHYRR